MTPQCRKLSVESFNSGISMGKRSIREKLSQS